VYFVGREKEVKQIMEALEEEKNVIVSGKYGMGRTSLIKYIAETVQDQWRFIFVDFSKTPGSVCNHLLLDLFPRQGFNRENTKYKSSRFRIVTLNLDDKRNHVLIFDNLAKLTPPKNDLLRYLTLEKRFQLVAIVESFLPPDDLFRLRVRLNPSELILLQYLGTENVINFFQHLSEEYQLHWSEVQIKNIAEMTGGYPLRMKELAVKAVQRKRQLLEGDEVFPT
jgi:hypothetical protein